MRACQGNDVGVCACAELQKHSVEVRTSFSVCVPVCCAQTALGGYEENCARDL